MAWNARRPVSDQVIMGYEQAVGERYAVFHYGSWREIALRERDVGLDFVFLKPSNDEVIRVEIPPGLTQGRW